MNNVILIYGLCDMVHRAMTLVKYFTPNFGEEYYDVLYGCYCRSRKAADVDIMIELGMSRATFYRKIDGVFYEISKEVAMAMFADYRNEIYRSRKWAPDDKEEDLQMEELQDLKIDNEKENAAKKKDKKWKRKTKRCEILDCAFSANSDGLSIADMADDTQLSLEELMILKEESKILHDKISKLTLQEQFIIKSIYFEGMKQKEVAEILGVTKGALSQRLGTILRKMRTMYLEG